MTTRPATTGAMPTATPVSMSAATAVATTSPLLAASVVRGPTAERLAGPALLAACLLLGGCSSWGNMFGSSAAPEAATMADPVAIAAGGAPVGSTVQTVGADGLTTTLRVERAYFAASGRECRDVSTLAAGSLAERRLLCREGLGWAWSRPVGGQTQAASTLQPPRAQPTARTTPRR